MRRLLRGSCSTARGGGAGRACAVLPAEPRSRRVAASPSCLAVPIRDRLTLLLRLSHPACQVELSKAVCYVWIVSPFYSCWTLFARWRGHESHARTLWNSS
jgi:hypothetical protein